VLRVRSVSREDLQTKPKKLTPDVDIPVRSPRTGVRTVFGVWGLGVEEVVVFFFSIFINLVTSQKSSSKAPRESTRAEALS